MASVRSSVTSDGPTVSEGPLVDPRAPRFGQALTALALATGIAFRTPALVYAVAVILITATLSGWRYDLYGFLWRVVLRVVDPPEEREPATPHRFAKLVGAAFTAVASLLLLAAQFGPAGAAVALAGYSLAGVVALLAGIAATFDYCLGCRMYEQVSVFRELGVV